MRVLASRYELQELIGRGGMGEVWQGLDRELGRTVAVKVLPAELTRHDEFRTRFRREARAVAALSHQGVATLYDVGEDTADGEVTPFLVMEYIDGRTLADTLRDGPIPVERALAIARDIADALVHSHGHGLIHRDIKPSNVMLTAAGGVKVLDFGIAKAVAETTTRLTATGMTVGTPAYLSPEQIEGSTVDGRSDLYSLGCLVHELLTGRPPFTGDSPFVVMNQHLMKEPVPPSALRPQILQAVDALVLRLLAKSPAERHASAAALRGALEEVQALVRAEAAGGAAGGAGGAGAGGAGAGGTPVGAAGAGATGAIPRQAAAPAGPSSPSREAAARTPQEVAALPTGRAPGPGGGADSRDIPAPPPRATLYAATRRVPHGLPDTAVGRSPWELRVRPSVNGLVAFAGIVMIPLTFFSADPDGFKGLNVVAVVAFVLALLALPWSARVSALLAWMPPAVLTGAFFSYIKNDAERESAFPYETYGYRLGWQAGDPGSRYFAVMVPVMLVVLFSLVAFFRSRTGSAAHIAVFWVAGMILSFSCGSLTAGATVWTGEVVLGVLLLAAVAQEIAGRRRAGGAPGET